MSTGIYIRKELIKLCGMCGAKVTTKANCAVYCTQCRNDKKIKKIKVTKMDKIDSLYPSMNLLVIQRPPPYDWVF